MIGFDHTPTERQQADDVVQKILSNTAYDFRKVEVLAKEYKKLRDAAMPDPWAGEDVV